MTTEEMLLERLAHIEDKLEGVARLETQLAAITGPWESLQDLGRDLSLLTDPAVKKLNEGMAEVEIGFQLEDFFALIKRLLPSLKYLTWSLEQLEEEGIFRINGAMLDMYVKLASHYTPEDVGTIGDGFVQFHEIVKKFANPRLIEFLEKLVDLPLEVRLEEVEPVGPYGLLWKMRQPECRQGLGVMLELTRVLGKLKAGPPPAPAP
jgi:uncharacterized protein YjgD (DUF1641 family)